MKKYIIGALIALSALVGFYAYAAPPVQQGYQGGTGISTSSFGSILVGPGGSFFNSYNQLALGSNGQCLQASSTSATGLIWASCASGSTGITSLNGLTGATQTFATDTSGSIFHITSSGSTHTFSLPFASASNTGQLQAADWTTFNNKASASGTAGSIQFSDGSNGLNADQSNFWWDNTNKFLGIGTSTLVAPLEVTSIPRDFINFSSTATQLSQLLVSNGGDIHASSTIGMQRFPSSEFNYDDTSGTGGDYHLIVATHGNVDPSLAFMISGGTTANPTALGTGRIMSFVGTRGYDGTEYGTPYLGTYNSDAGMEVYSTTNFSTTSHGTEMVLRVTPPNSIIGAPTIIINPNDSTGIRGNVAVQGFPGQTIPQFTVGPSSTNASLTVNYVGTTTLLTVASTSGNSLFQIQSNGNVGIGVGNAVGAGAPNNTLQIISLADPKSNLATSTNWPVMILNPTTNSSSTGIGFGVTTSSQVVNGGIGYQRKGSGGYGDMFFATTPNGGSLTEGMRLDSQGNLSIATLTPTTLIMTDANKNLQSVTLGTNLSFSGTTLNATGGGGGSGVGTTSPFIAGYIPEATGTNVTLSNSNIFQSTNGNIGIATQSPTALLQISGTTNAPYLLLQNRNASSSYANNEPSFVANGDMGGLEVDLGNAISTATTTILKLSGSNNQNGPGGVAIGYNAGANWDYSKNYNASGGYIAPIFIGYEAGQNMTASTTASGPSGPQDNPFGSIFIGDQTEYLATPGTGGNLAGETTVVGSEAMVDNFAGSNAVLGYDAGLGCLNCASSVFVGDDVGNHILTANSGTYIGDGASSYSQGDDNVMIGHGAGIGSPTVSFTPSIQGNDNVMIGSQAGAESYNTSSPSTVQNNNVLIGYGSNSVGTSTNETVVGFQAGGAQTVINSPNCYLSGPLSGCRTHVNNSVFGYQAAGLNISGSNNLMLGYQAAYSLVSGSNDIVLGYNTDLPATTTSNTLDIGNLIYATGLTNFSQPTSGLSNGNVGIGTSTPGSELVVQVPSIPFLDSSYSSANQSGTLPMDNNGDYVEAGNTFIAASGTLSSVQFYLDKAGTVSGNLTAYVYNISGTPGTNAVPTGAALATSTTVAATSLPSSLGLVSFTFTGVNAITLTSGTTYFVSVAYSNTASPNQVNFGYGSIAFANNNIAYNNGSWFGTGALNGVYNLYETPLSNNNPVLVVASTSGTSLFQVAANGSTTLSSLGTGCVGANAGSLYIATANCSSGGGSGTVLSSSSSTVPIYFGNGTTLGGAPESYYETGEGSAGYGFVVGTNGSPYNIPAFGDTRVVDNTAQGPEASFLDMKSFISSTTNSSGAFIDKENIGGNNGSMDHVVGFQDSPVITQSVGIPDIYGFVSTPQIGGGANGARIAFEANPAIVTNTPTTTVYEDIGFDCPSEMGAETGVTEGWCFASAGQNNIMKGLLLGDQNSYIHDKTASLEIESNSANAKLRLGNTSGDYWDLYATGTPSNQFVIGDYYGQVVSVVSSGGGSTGGKVGINTTSPSQNFVVVGTTNITGTSTFATTTINGTLTVPSIANCNSTQYLQITSGLFGCGTPAGGGGGSGGGWATSSPAYITTTYPNTTGALVGINSSTPTAQLVVEGTAGTTTPVFEVATSSNVSEFQITSAGKVVFTGQQLGQNGSVTNPSYSFSNTTNGGMFTPGGSNIAFAAGGTQALNLDANNNQIAIGNASTWNGTAALPAIAYNGSGGEISGVYWPTTAGTSFGISTNGVQRMLFDSSGDVGINSSTPTALLTLQGYSGATTDLLNVATNTGVSLLKVLSNGNVGIGSSTPTANLVVQASTAD